MQKLLISKISTTAIRTAIALLTASLLSMNLVWAGEEPQKDATNSEIVDVMQKYIDGTKQGDVELLKSIFHTEARMIGYMGPNLLTGGPEPFFDTLISNPPDDAFRAAYKSKLRDIEVSGTVARATLEEEGFYSRSFVNHFHLLKVDDAWLITSKVFQVTK